MSALTLISSASAGLKPRSSSALPRVVCGLFSSPRLLFFFSLFPQAFLHLFPASLRRSQVRLFRFGSGCVFFGALPRLKPVGFGSANADCFRRSLTVCSRPEAASRLVDIYPSLQLT